MSGRRSTWARELLPTARTEVSAVTARPSPGLFPRQRSAGVSSVFSCVYELLHFSSWEPPSRFAHLPRAYGAFCFGDVPVMVSGVPQSERTAKHPIPHTA